MWQIPKILKILISVLVAVSMALTPFAGMGFNVRSEAVGSTIIQGLKWAVIEWLKSIGLSVADFSVQYLTDKLMVEPIMCQMFAEDKEQIMVNTLSSENGVTFSLSHIHGTDDYLVSAESSFDLSSFSAEEQDFINYFVKYINDNPTIITSANGETVDTAIGQDTISVKGYEGLKSAASNAYTAYLLDKMAVEFAVDELRTALDNNYAGPAYNFDFVGPTPTLELPLMSSYGSYDYSGFFFSQPITVTIKNGFTYLTEGQCETISYPGCTSYRQNSSGQWFFHYGNNVYGCLPYVLHDGKIFYCTDPYAGTKISNYNASLAENFYDLYVYKAIDGTTLADYDVPMSKLYGGTGSLQVGYILKLRNDTNYKSPLEAYTAGAMSEVTSDNFSKTIGGAVSIPHTMAEQIIGQAEKLGLLNSDSLLSLDSTGEIAAADDITIAKLQELCQLMADGNLQFESVQEYLDLITKLVSSGNVTAKAQETILSNVEKYAKTQAKDVAEIKAAVKSLTDVKELEKEDIELDAIIVEHTGLAEAEALVKSALPIVEQSKQLITNVLNQAEAAPDYVPNFSFYWDSNKDGITEKYTALDLSFMETTLTNENLEDKNRFEKPMTVKEFIQALIVFIVYVIFAVKLLRRIPGFLGGSESVSDDIKTFNTKKGN